MKEMDELTAVMRRLRAPDGCPWDREQTHESLKKNLIEEAAEYLDAVDDADDAHMKEELGDLMMQVVLHSVIAEERGAFTINEVAHDITEKMIRRHPHVFGSEKVENTAGVLTLWEKVKQAEKAEAGKTGPVSLMDRIPRNLPALRRAEKAQKKAAKVGFDWTEAESVFQKLQEEFHEVEEAHKAGDEAHLEEELGDLMFTVVNYARARKQSSAEEMLNRATDKFMRRFRYVEEWFRKQGRADFEGAASDEMDALWNEAKKQGL